MRSVIPALVAMFATSAGHGQLAWVMDTTFRTDIEWRGISDIEFLSNGLLISGEMKFANDLTVRHSALLDDQGGLITSFESWGGGGTIAQWNDRYYLGTAAYVVREFENGSMDYSFSAESIFISSIHGGQFHTYPDGKVLMTGGHDLWSLEDTTFLGPNHCLVRLDTTGALDPTFQHRRCQNGVTQKILRLPDGKFLLAGQQDIYDDQPVGHVLRVHPDGSIDTTFRTTIDYGYATDYYFYPDGRILCSGWFHTPELPGDTVQFLRLLPNGSVDHSFNYDMDFQKFPGIEYPPAVIQGMYELDPATLLIGGSFTTLNDEWVGGIFVMDTAGTILQDHFTGMGCDSLISLPNILSLGLRDFELAPDGSLYAYGFFHGFDDGYINDPDQRMIVKLVQVDVGGAEQEQPVQHAIAYPNPGSEHIQLEWPGHAIVSWVLCSMEGRLVLSGTATATKVIFDARALVAGAYLLSVCDNQGLITNLKWTKP